MAWYHRIATFLQEALPQLRATRCNNLALLTAAHPGSPRFVHIRIGTGLVRSVALFPPSAEEATVSVPIQHWF